MTELFFVLLLAAAPARAAKADAAPAKADAAPAETDAAPAKATLPQSAVQWFTHLKQGLSRSAVEAHYQQGRSIGAVAAVRGAGQSLDDPDKPYWKGTAGSKAEKRLRKERAELGEAVDLILAGKTDEGSKRLDAFEIAHPGSPLLADLKEAREKLKAAAAPAAKENSKEPGATKTPPAEVPKAETKP